MSQITTRGALNRRSTPKYEQFQREKPVKKDSPKKASTPEKAVIEQLDQDLDKGVRLVKTTQLGLEMQKSNLTSCSNVSYLKGLMPKRIMSAVRKNSK